LVSTKVPEVMESVSASSKNCGGSILVVVRGQVPSLPKSIAKYRIHSTFGGPRPH